MTVHLEHFLDEIGVEPVTQEDSGNLKGASKVDSQPADALKSNPGTQVAPSGDYDYAGAMEAGVKQDETGHWPDTFKLPNHISFSSDSKYHDAEHEGGKWEKSDEGKWSFTPGPENFKHHSPAEMQQYFRQHEPDVKLNMPQGDSIPIMRHGETEENVTNTAHGWSNESLIPEGRKEVEKTANTLAASNPPTIIAHSDLKRAAESAKIVADKTGAKMVAIPELRTWDIGNFAGKDCGECEKELKPYVDNPDKRVPGGESFNDFRRRVTEGFHKSLAAGADMLVTHNKTERLIAAMEKSESPHEVFDHNGGPEPGQMRKIQLAGDVIPFPKIPMAGARSTGARGRSSIVDFEDQAYFKGEKYAPDTSKVKNLTPKEPGQIENDTTKYNEAVFNQQWNRMAKEGKENVRKALQRAAEKDYEDFWSSELGPKPSADILPFPGRGARPKKMEPEDFLE